MKSPKLLIALSLVCLCSTAVHATVVVGTCRTGLHSYPTITTAIQAVHPNEVISVCPGTYAEQLTITKPLAIEAYSTSSQVNVTDRSSCRRFATDSSQPRAIIRRSS